MLLAALPAWGWSVQSGGPGLEGLVPSHDVCLDAEPIPAAGPFPYLTAITSLAQATSLGDPAPPTCQPHVERGIWYSFRPAQAGVYRFSSSAQAAPLVPFAPAPTFTSVGDTVLAVYQGDLGCLGPFTQLACDEDSGIAEQAELTVTLAADVQYFVLLWQFGEAADVELPLTGAQLFVSKIQPPNDACPAAIALQLDLPLPATTVGAANDAVLSASDPCFAAGLGNLATSAPGREIVYSFTAPQAGAYSFRVDGVRSATSTTPDPVLYLTDGPLCPAQAPPSPVSCLAAANRRSGTGVSEEIPCVPLSSGQTVYLHVDEASSGSVVYGAIVQVTRCTAESEPNGLAQPDPLGFGIEGAAGTGSDVDFYALGVPSPGTRLFALLDAAAAANEDFDLRITTSGSTLEYDDADADSSHGEQSAVVAGTILGSVPTFLRVSHTSAAQPYRLYAVLQPPLADAQLEVEPNGTLELASGFAGSANYFRGSLSAADDQDFYTFLANAGELLFVALDLDPLRNGTPFDGRLDLLDANGNLLASVNGSGTGSSTTAGGTLTSTTPRSPAEALVFRVRVTGRHYVRVVTGLIGFGDYLLSISPDGLNALAPTPTVLPTFTRTPTPPSTRTRTPTPTRPTSTPSGTPTGPTSTPSATPQPVPVVQEPARRGLSLLLLLGLAGLGSRALRSRRS